MHVAVIGAGIGGLATSLALRRAGISTTVFERGQRFTTAGVGLVLAPNGIRALDMLGVGDAVRTLGHCMTTESAYPVSTPDGQSLGAIGYGEFQRRHGLPFVVIRRTDLQQILLNAHGGAGLRTGAELAAVRIYEDGEELATAKFSDGLSFSADVLVGADGLRSVVRAELFGTEPPRRVAATLRGITKAALPEDRSDGFTVVGPGFGMFFAALGPEEMYWTATINDMENWPRDPGESFRRVLDQLAGWPSIVLDLVRAADPDSLVVTDLADRPPLSEWSHGPVTLVGDAAHPMTNFLGQGANTTLEDAGALARWLAEAEDVTDALAGYELERIPRTTRIVQGAAGLFGREWGAKTEHVFASYLERVLNGKFMDWVYSYSPERAPAPARRSRRHVEIAGAGFAGLTAAIAFAERGWTVQVHESGTELRDFGAGIFLWENGLRVLEALGCASEVLAKSHEAQQWEERDSTGALMSTRPLPLPGGLRMVTLTRQALYAALLAKARSVGVRFRTGSTVVDAGPDGFLVTHDGSLWSADLVIGADGIRSKVRDALGLPAGHQVFDFGMYRFLVPRHRAPGRDGRWGNYVNYWNLERRRRVLYVPCDEDEIYINLGAVGTDAEAIRTPLDESVWRESFPAVESLLAGLPTTPRFDRYEVVRLARWSAGRAAVVGDAAHAMPPTIGQGAGTAMMNALSLAVTIAGSDDIEASLRDWEASERPETEQTQETSVALLDQLFPSGNGSAHGQRQGEWTDEPLRPAQRAPRA